MQKSVWDRVVDSTPIDRNAKNVASSGGEHYAPESSFGTARWFTDCPPLFSPQKGMRDLTGITIGHMRVVGFGGPGNGWVCRCVCGRFEFRRTKGVLRPKPSSDLATCFICGNTRRIRNFGQPSIFGRKKKVAN